MAETIQSPSQADLAAATLTDVYVVPLLTSAVVSSITVANRTNGNLRYRLSVAVGGAADVVAQYFAYDVLLGNRSTDTWTLGISLGPGDVVRARADVAGCSINVFKSELT